MPTIRNSFSRALVVLFAAFFTLSFPSHALAQIGHRTNCANLNIAIINGDPGGKTFSNNGSDELDIRVAGTIASSIYSIEVEAKGQLGPLDYIEIGTIPGQNNGNEVTFQTSDTKFFSWPGRHFLTLHSTDVNGNTSVCAFPNSYYEVNNRKSCSEVQIFQERGIDVDNDGQPDKCYGGGGGCIDGSSPVTVRAVIYDGGQPTFSGDDFNLEWSGTGSNQYKVATTNNAGVLIATWDSLAPGDRQLIIEDTLLNVPNGIGVNIANCKRAIRVDSVCDETKVDACQATAPTSDTVGGYSRDVYKFCQQITDADLQKKCLDCTEVDEDGDGTKDYKGVWTAIGCIKRDPEAIAQKLILVGLSTGGGVSLLMGIAAGFLLSTSQGDPKRTGEAKEMMTAAVTGLMFIIFSVTILQFIGFTVLKIPGFGG